MLRSSWVVLFSLSLMFSMVSPLVLGALHFDYAKVGIVDSTNEDSQNNSESGLEEDGKTIQSFQAFPGVYFVSDAQNFHFYLGDFQSHLSSIILPPPEFLQ